MLLVPSAWAQNTEIAPASRSGSAAPEARQSESVATATASARPTGGKSQPDTQGAAQYSAGVDEILKMVQSGISTEVARLYIENSPIAYELSAADIIALKDHAVPDELVTAMIKRGAALKRQARQTMMAIVNAATSSGGNRRYGALDPEGYDYFQYYYLYPRTLAAANQRLFSPSPSFSRSAPYHYGYWGPVPFNPYPPSAFSHP